MPVLMNPDCLDQKHRACSGDGWCEDSDRAVPCPCSCHQPTHTAMQAKHLSGASIGKLIEYETGRDIVTGAHLWSPTAVLGAVRHIPDAVELWLEWNDEAGDEHELKPTDWVRVTRVAA